MKRALLILFFPLLFLYGCNTLSTKGQQSSSSQDSAHYASLIMTVVMNNYKYLIPDDASEGIMLRSDPNYYLYKATKVLKKTYKKDSLNGFLGYKEVKDKALSLTLRVHRWTCGCEISLPNTVIYVNNHKDVEYAFVFREENPPRNENDSLTQVPYPDGPARLQFQVNFLANALKLNSATGNGNADRFLSLIVDSLLEMQRITIKDIGALTKEEETLKQTNGNSICAENIDKEMQQMIAELKSGDNSVLYYRSSSRYYKGYWRFQFTIDMGHVYIKAQFNKTFCGKVFTT